MDETVKSTLQTIDTLIFTKRQRAEGKSSNESGSQATEWSTHSLFESFGAIELRRYPVAYIYSLVDCLYETDQLVPTLVRLFEALNVELPKLLVRCNAYVVKSAQAVGESLPLATQTHTTKYLVDLVELALRMCNYVVFFIRVVLDRVQQLGRADPRLLESLGNNNRSRNSDAISMKTVWTKVQNSVRTFSAATETAATCFLSCCFLRLNVS